MKSVAVKIILVVLCFVSITNIMANDSTKVKRKNG